MSKISKQLLLFSGFMFFIGVLNWFLVGDFFSGNMEKGIKSLTSAFIFGIGSITFVTALFTIVLFAEENKKQSSK